MLARDTPAPEPRELRACALAAIAEAGVVALPVHLIVSESGSGEVRASWLVPLFALAYALGAVVVCRFRRSSGVVTGAVIVAALLGIAAGHGELNRTIFLVAIAMAVAFRVVTLGVRDWRTPLHAEIGWFAVALGVEAAIASGPEPEWRPLLVAIVPIFFVAALASRASTVWTGGGVHDLDDEVRRAWIRRALVATAALVGVMASAVALSVRGGLFDRVGQAMTPVADAAASFVGWLLGQAARPLFWLVDRLGIDPQAVREFFERLRNGGLGRRLREQAARPDAALWQRLLGLAVFVLIGYMIFRAIRRLRPEIGEDEPRRAPVISAERDLGDEPAPIEPRIRRELPADQVRRRYAEALLALEHRSVAKPRSATPGEFVDEVSRAYPSAASDFLRLTRAYEDVRYGSLQLDGRELHELDARADAFLRVVATQAPVELVLDAAGEDGEDGVGSER
jgi:uncharacterized protein DUF4129